MSGSDYYVVWLQVQRDLLADDEMERNRATNREKENRETERENPFRIKGRISSPHKQMFNTIPRAGARAEQ